MDRKSCRPLNTVSLIILLLGNIGKGQPSISIEPAHWYTGTTLTLTCDLTGITTIGVCFFKDMDQIYTCPFTNSPCSDKYGLSDYSDVDWSQTGKAVFTISNADSTRDNGDWTCSGDDITQKSMETSLSITETLVISTLYVKVTKHTAQLSWKPEFEPVPNTTYATCAQNGLTENAEFIDGLLVVEFRHLIPERQHDVIIYCQNPADMKLYKSETFAVFTLKDSSNTNPRECSTVLALHSLDLTVSQRKVGLSWTSPIAFESTKVEYWFGSDKNITISANKPSHATSNAEMNRLLPGRMITFTITGEKDGTTYPSGTLHQKTLKD